MRAPKGTRTVLLLAPFNMLLAPVEGASAGIRWAHFKKIALTWSGQFFNDNTSVFIINIDCDFFDWLMTHAVNFGVNNLWTRNRKFETFTTHVFNQNTHLQFAAT